MKKELLFMGLLVLIIIFVSGQQGCQMPGQKTIAKKTGIDYTLISGMDYISSGRLLEQGEPFYVGVKIENYDKEQNTGEICIRDDVSDAFGGISSETFGDCKPFNVKAAEIVKKKVTGFGGEHIQEETIPGGTEVYFPMTGEYSYHGLPISNKPWSQKLFVSLKYRKTTQATATITVPGLEQPVLNQEPSPISISLTKSIHKREDNYVVDLEILLKKQQNAKIFSWDFSQENMTYFMAEMVPQTMSCKVSGESITGLINFENERLIKCSSLIYISGGVQQSYPLIITLDYGVDIEKNYPFAIKTKVD